MIIGVLGNVTVIIYAIFFNKEKTATSYLTGNLALADLLVCLTLYPIWIFKLIQIILNIDNNQDFFCKFSRSAMWAFMFASIATLLAITVERYLYIVKPLRYPQIVTHRRVFLAVSGIWIIASCFFIVHFIHDKGDIYKLRSLCYIPESIYHLSDVFAGYLPLIFIFFMNFHILLVARKQRKRILVKTTIPYVDNSPEESGNTSRISFCLRCFVALKEAKTFAIVVAVLTFCILIPKVVGWMLSKFCTVPCWQLWYIVFFFELNGINSIVNAFIYGMRHVKYRKAYLHILFKLFFCQKATN